MSLSDINHLWGQDIQLSNTGDLALVSGTPRGQQRIIRRLMTNQGDYLFQPNYGAGVLKAIGSTEDSGSIVATVRSQVLLEDSVAQSPAPVTTIANAPGNSDGSALAVSIQYTDSPSNAPTVLAFVATP